MEGIRLHSLNGEWEACTRKGKKLHCFRKWTLLEDGTAINNETGQSPEDEQLMEVMLPNSTAAIYRTDGWFVDMQKSSLSHLVWKHARLPGEVDWIRIEASVVAEPKKNKACMLAEASDVKPTLQTEELLEEPEHDIAPKKKVKPRMSPKKRVKPRMQKEIKMDVELTPEFQAKSKNDKEATPMDVDDKDLEASNEIESDEEEEASNEYESVIVECGTYECKIGLSEQQEPHIRVPCPRMFADKAFWTGVLTSIGLKPGDPEPVVIGLPYTTSMNVVHEIYSLLFRDLGMKHAYVATSAFFAAEKFECCILVDVGESGAYAVQKGPPSFAPQHSTFVCGGIGGGLLNEAMNVILQRAGASFPEDADHIAIGRAAKECFGYVAQVFDDEVARLKKLADVPNACKLKWSREPARKLPSGVRFKPERGEGCRCCELLFNPESEGILADCRAKPSKKLELSTICGTWLQPMPATEEIVSWRIQGDGLAFRNGVPADANANLRETLSGDGTKNIFNGDGWRLNASSSSIDRLIWEKSGDIYIWQRDPAERTEFLSLQELIFRSIQQTSDMQTRERLLSNILVVGNSGIFPGLAQRLEREVRHRCTEVVPGMDPGNVRVHIMLDPTRKKNIAWQGAALLADYKEFKKFLMTPEYFEAASREKTGIVFV